MIDTVILTIPKKDFVITDLLKFGTTRKAIDADFSTFRKYVNNPTKEDKDQGIYKPRLTMIKRGRAYSLKIEFSVPKLLIGNNLNELSEDDFSRVIKILQLRLKDMSVRVSEEALRNASVLSFHPSKNIILESGYTPSFVIKELGKIDLTKKLDMTKVDFRNEGQSLQCYSISHSFVIYDKIQDMKQYKGRAIDKDQTLMQLSLFKKHRELQVIRIEVRLSKKDKLNSIFKKFGYKINPSFQDIFKKDLCQKIVKLYWDQMIAGENLFLFEMDNPERVLDKIIKNNHNIKAKELIYTFGLNISCKSIGIRNVRHKIERLNSKRSWLRVKADIKKLNDNKFVNHQDWVKQIIKAIDEFQPLIA